MRSTSTQNLILNALFVALVLILGTTSIGMIPLGVINLTIIHIPVIVGTLFLGLKSGLLLGFFFGLCSVLSAFGLTLAQQSSLAGALGAQSPLLLIVMSMVPRLLIPVITCLMHETLKSVNKHFSSAIAAAFGSITNTVFYLSLMVIFYNISGLDVDNILRALGIENLGFFGIVGVIAGGGGGLEALAAFLIVPPITLALDKVKKQTYWSN